MIEIRINKDPREYKDKILAGFTLRQLICLILLLGINIPLYIYGGKYIGKDLIEYAIMLTSVPLVMIGFFEYNKMPFERVIWAAFESQFRQPIRRKYSSKNVIQIMDEHIIKTEVITQSKDSKRSKHKVKLNNKKKSRKKSIF